MRNAVLAFLFFAPAAFIGWYFIRENSLMYGGRIYLAAALSALKWIVPVLVAARLLPATARPAALRRIAFVSCIGALLLLPFCFAPVKMLTGSQGFYLSLLLAALATVFPAYRAVRKSGLSAKWFAGWLLWMGLVAVLQVLFAYYDTSII